VLPAVGSTTVPPSPVAAFEHAFEHVLPDAVLDARTGVERLQLRVHRHRVRGVVYPNERRLPDRLQHRRQGLPRWVVMLPHRCRLLCVFPWLRRPPLVAVCGDYCRDSRRVVSEFVVGCRGSNKLMPLVRFRRGMSETDAQADVTVVLPDGEQSSTCRRGDSRRRCLRDRPRARSRHGRGEDRRRTRRKVRDGPRRRTDRDRHGSVRRVPHGVAPLRRPRVRAGPPAAPSRSDAHDRPPTDEGFSTT